MLNVIRRPGNALDLMIGSDAHERDLFLAAFCAVQGIDPLPEEHAIEVAEWAVEFFAGRTR